MNWLAFVWRLMAAVCCPYRRAVVVVGEGEGVAVFLNRSVTQRNYLCKGHTHTHAHTKGGWVCIYSMHCRPGSLTFDIWHVLVESLFTALFLHSFYSLSFSLLFLLFSFSLLLLLLLLLVSSTRRHYSYKYSRLDYRFFNRRICAWVCVCVSIPWGFAYFSGSS